MMDNDSHIDYELLSRYLGGELDDQERQEVDSWVAQSPDNEKELGKLRAIWNGVGQESKVDVDAAWQDLRTEADVALTGGEILTSLDVEIRYDFAIDRWKLIGA